MKGFYAAYSGKIKGRVWGVCAPNGHNMVGKLTKVEAHILAQNLNNILADHKEEILENIRISLGIKS